MSTPRRRREGLTFFFLVGPAVLVILALTVFPLLYSLQLSFFKWNISIPYAARPFVGVQNYARALADPNARIVLRNTLTFVGASVSLELLIGFALAILLNRPLRGKGLIISLLILPVMVAPVVVGIMWRLLYDPSFGVFNDLLRRLGLEVGVEWLTDSSLALPSVIITDVWQWTPLMFLVLYAGVLSLPEELYEVAAVDGASPFRQFVSITLPLMTPTIAIAVLLRGIDAFKVFDSIWVLTGGGPGQATESLSMYVYRTAFKFFDLGYAAALSYVLLLVISILASGFIRILRVQEAGEASGA